jgi:hypothetical protein
VTSLARQTYRIQLQIQGEQSRLEQVQARGRWSEADIELKRIAIAELEDCLRTFHWLLENEARIKAALAGEAA